MPKSSLTGLVALALVLVSGCTGSGAAAPTLPPPSSPTVQDTASRPSESAPPTARPTVPADVPTTGPNVRDSADRVPVMPVAATRHTEAGAVAFSEFFIRTIDWGYATTSPAYMDHYYAQSCIDCRSAHNALEYVKKRGGHYIGGRLTLRATHITRVPPRLDSEVSTRVTLDVESIEAVDKNNKFLSGDIAYAGYHENLWLEWTQLGWRVIDMEGSR